jgi:riboflavin kinase/FMN adenylyltransferase
VVAWDDAVLPLRERCATALGVFDGVHRGHQALIARTRVPGLTSVVVTFVPHPAQVLFPERFSGTIMTTEQRLSGFEALGIDVCLVVEFTDSFHELPGRRFLAELSRRMELEQLIVGFNFRCGYNMDMPADAIAEYFASTETSVEIVPPVQAHGDLVSSSRLRKLIQGADLDEYRHVSGREFVIDLRAYRKSSVEEVELNTGRIARSDQIVPQPGVYSAVSAENPGREIDLVITDHYLKLPLAANESLLYIVRNRTAKGDLNALN